MALSEGKKKAAKPQAVRREAPPQKEKRKEKEEKTAGLTASGEVKVGAAKYKGYVLKDFAARYSYSDGNVTISPISTGLSGGKEAVVQGTAKGELRVSVAGESAADSVKKTLAGKLTADLSKCEVIETKISSAIALFTGIKELASPKFDAVHFLLTVGNEKIALAGTMTSSLISLNPSGTVWFDKKMDVIADLRVAPSLGGRIDSTRFARYIKDEKGWTVIPLRITGTADKPSVGLNQAAVGKQVEKGVKQEIEKRLFKGIFGK
jgi:AsmA protein